MAEETTVFAPIPLKICHLRDLRGLLSPPMWWHGRPCQCCQFIRPTMGTRLDIVGLLKTRRWKGLAALERFFTNYPG